ncbi:hypothetical protein JNW90_13225 [Micromonospora sp. STR1s_5]|nr:hypothetical protein [Micromonospora sp. STR1s_5]
MNVSASEWPITLELTASELAQLDGWIAIGLSPEQSRVEAVREIVLAALGVREQLEEQADRRSMADDAFAAHLRSKGFLPE